MTTAWDDYPAPQFAGQDTSLRAQINEGGIHLKDQPDCAPCSPMVMPGSGDPDTDWSELHNG